MRETDEGGREGREGGFLKNHGSSKEGHCGNFARNGMREEEGDDTTRRRRKRNGECVAVLVVRNVVRLFGSFSCVLSSVSVGIERAHQKFRQRHGSYDFGWVTCSATQNGGSRESKLHL
ncbi:hypothetical protein AAC387_Pa12g1444 [Persea americana]